MLIYLKLEKIQQYLEHLMLMDSRHLIVMLYYHKD